MLSSYQCPLNYTTILPIGLVVDALEIGLVDKLITSDDYIQERIIAGEKVLKLIRFQRPKFTFGGGRAGGIPGILQNSFRLMHDTMSELGALIKRINETLEDAPGADLSRIATAHAASIQNIRTSLQ